MSEAGTESTARAADILRGLATIESTQGGTHILYAGESGSRAWGFASRDSDWDVRFLYVLRLALACLWIERGLGQPPVAFAELMEALIPEGALRVAILGLLERKASGDELDRGAPIPELDDLLTRELVRLQAGTATPPAPGIDVARLDALLWDCVIPGPAPVHRDLAGQG